jgi:hypothetical protein
MAELVLRIILIATCLPEKINWRKPVTTPFVLTAELHAPGDEGTICYELYGSLLHLIDNPHTRGHSLFPLPREFEQQREGLLFQVGDGDMVRIQRHINELIESLRTQGWESTDEKELDVLQFDGYRFWLAERNREPTVMRLLELRLVQHAERSTTM